MQKIHPANETLPVCLTNRLRSFAFAFRGLAVLLRTQPNARIHLVMLIAVCISGACLQIHIWEWCAIFLAAGGVWTTESLNTALEFLGDHASLQRNPIIRDAKDLAAASVLIASFVALLIGLIIFGSRLLFHLGPSGRISRI